MEPGPSRKGPKLGAKIKTKKKVTCTSENQQLCTDQERHSASHQNKENHAAKKTPPWSKMAVLEVNAFALPYCIFIRPVRAKERESIIKQRGGTLKGVAELEFYKSSTIFTRSFISISKKPEEEDAEVRCQVG